ncbi:MAG TPA: AAA family ATPase [Kineosporiaceae bacterium]|nr:AAA family ATPase [Kineosporiaceae bacterium]
MSAPSQPPASPFPVDAPLPGGGTPLPAAAGGAARAWAEVPRAGGSSDLAWVADRFERLLDNVERVIQGKRPVVARAALCLLAEGHLLLEDVPGVGKTTLAKALSSSIDGTVRRLQCTPDLLPSDVTGVQLWDASSREFVFHEGPVFANVLLTDEINRSPAKTQAALLEVMQERQVTVDAVPYAVPRPFLVIATQNPIEHSGTYELPEAQLDRFMMKARIGYPQEIDEVAVVDLRTTRADADDLTPVMTTTDLASMIAATSQVYLSPEVRTYIVRLASATRPGEPHPQERELREVRQSVMLGASPRASVTLARAAQAAAASRGRAYVTGQDVKELAVSVLAHRLILQPEAELEGVTAESVIERITPLLPDVVAGARA